MNRAVTGGMVTQKTSPVAIPKGASVRECAIAAASNVPFDYAPPPEDMLLRTVPYKWPVDEDWSRAQALWGDY